MHTAGSVDVNGVRAAAPEGVVRWLARTGADVVRVLTRGEPEAVGVGTGSTEFDGSGRCPAVDDDAGLRVGLRPATPALVALATSAVERAAAHRERWSDHARVTVSYPAREVAP